MKHDSTTEARPLDETSLHDTPLHDIALDAIPVDGIEAAYDARGLDRLSDEQLVTAVAAVVAQPREEPANSFVLHSPLELTARARLLARTPASHRRLARLRLVSIAARYQQHPPADLAVGTGTGTAVDAGSVDPGIEAVLDAIDAGDLEGVDAAVQRLTASRPHPASILGPLATAVARRTAAAAHAPIFLATLAETPDHAPGWLPLLRPLTRELARRPDWAITWMDRTGSDASPKDDNATVDPEALFVALADPPRLGVPGSSFIHPLLMQVDAPGVADAVLGPIVGLSRAGAPTDPGQAGAKAVTRVAALAMVRDDPSHAPYGWTHCLTLPQAILTLAPHIDRGDHPGSALAIAATQVLAFRAAQGSVTLDPNDELLTPADPATAGARAEALIIEAARRHDAHIAKYILASLTAATTDPEASEVHLTAAEHLLSVWDGLGPDPDEVLASVAVS